MQTDIEQRLDLKAKLLPKTGYNLVVLDDYAETIPEELSLVKHFETLAEANAKLARLQKANPDTRYFIYGPNGAP